jgi:hypothetical protein
MSAPAPGFYVPGYSYTMLHETFIQVYLPFTFFLLKQLVQEAVNCCRLRIESWLENLTLS